MMLRIALAGMMMGFAQLSSRAPPIAMPTDVNEHGSEQRFSQ